MSGRGPWAAAAFATRGLVQAAASELRERGVHVALLIVDASIESEKTRERLEGKPPSSPRPRRTWRLPSPTSLGQSPRAWTHELQLTPSGDGWVP